ncbi:Crp/Fnr family transcriptional regulator [Clostridium septicum]|uniref:Crp/Fnr family transcriptional regulator n=1 Tax=Clostridium septicum TaxID=1504 RepID=A0A9N7JL61_CLOSE|nr:Crp/Fnr family transcriptional regulator [Clostridium septicum]AYE34413.1 Crp/Fnr family transcriptional regulator [Clostridium septicum]MDU1312524.1 Crp/Fnr family transcriptional regulator [Clostridium septicum]QAS59818.1 Crp/Fnr family transcriptional regulator [Clostridium septicum]UEC20943.1 Crp/Fnr family transcriptional regulator [Clostridium septicum]USS01009.1 Crp/Fnr family transcriptional regulator [Clostridium septicum]
MNEFLEVIGECSIFKKIKKEDIKNFIENSSYKLASYDKNDIIAVEGEDCNSIGIVVDGIIEIQNIYENGKNLTIKRFSRGDVFGEALVFSKQHIYPATIISVSKSKILFINKESIINFCFKDVDFLNNFMCLLSEKIIMLNNKIRNTSLKSIRQKISNFLLEQYNIREKTVINLNISKKEFAEILGIPRPSLSRELINMKDEGIIDLNKREINILDIDKLEEIMCK